MKLIDNRRMENNQIELAIVKGSTSGAFTLMRDGTIRIADDTSYEQWCELLRQVKWWRQYLEVGFSTVIEWGKLKFGEDKVNHELEQMEFEAILVKTACTIGSIPEELRFPNLNGQHYVELARADLSPKDQIRWAKIASEQLLTPTQLRYSIPQGEVVDQSVAKAQAHGVITPHGIRQMFDIYMNRIGGRKGLLGMEEDIKEEVLGELGEIRDVTNMLEEDLVLARGEPIQVE